MKKIVVLSGAGISAESGLATFRGPDGLWEGHHVEDVCTPEALARNAALVHRFYDERRAKLHEVDPNPAHRALAALDAQWAGDLLIVTQNVDDLQIRNFELKWDKDLPAFFTHGIQCQDVKNLVLEEYTGSANPMR